MISSIARSYLNPDQAWRHNLDNARFMRNDPAIMECLEARQRATALLDWHIEVDGPPLPYHKALQERLTRIFKKIPYFTEYRRNLLEAIWYGKQGVQHRYGYLFNADGNGGVSEDMGIIDWSPIQGDKVVFRIDDGRADHPLNQVGVRVGPHHRVGDILGGREVVATEAGLATFLSAQERHLVTIHKHFREDAAWEDPISSGSIHGIGVRSRIYWLWFQKQELMALLMEYMERSALGFEIWYFPEGNKEAESAVEKAARNRVGRRNIILFPKPIGGDEMGYGVEHVEPGASGAEQMLEILRSLFMHQIKRYILGQTLTSEAAATGLGSGVAELHLNTMLDIVKYDATNLEETISRETLEHIKLLNDKNSIGVDVRFIIETQSPTIEERMQSYQVAWQMGARLTEKAVLDVIGLGEPDTDDVILQNPAIQQAQMQMQMANQQMAMAEQQAQQEQPPPGRDHGRFMLAGR